jgi:opacity protein-like surface antigen
MTRIAAVTILFIISITSSFSQTHWGIKAGANVTNINLNKEYEDVFDTKAENRVGYQLGLIAQRELNENVFLRGEIYYTIKGYKYYQRDLDTEAKRAFNYIILPVFVGYNVIPNLSVFLGPQIGLLGAVNYKQKNGDRVNVRHIVDYNNLDIGAGAGIAYKITPKIGMDIRYTYGFSSLSKYEIRDGSMNYLSALEEKNNKTLDISMNYFFKPKK